MMTELLFVGVAAVVISIGCHIYRAGKRTGSRLGYRAGRRVTKRRFRR